MRLSLLLVVLALGACGQRGPLYFSEAAKDSSPQDGVNEYADEDNSRK